MIAYTATTEDVNVTVRPLYLDERSDPITRRFVFGYFIRIENHGLDDVQLLRRHWIIQDSSGQTKEVEGDGVVGLQPVIAPGTIHEYNSFCVLETFEGSMQGNYLMQRRQGDRFKVLIPRFTLRAAAN